MITKFGNVIEQNFEIKIEFDFFNCEFFYFIYYYIVSRKQLEKLKAFLSENFQTHGYFDTWHIE